MLGICCEPNQKANMTSALYAASCGCMRMHAGLLFSVAEKSPRTSSSRSHATVRDTGSHSE